jgi:hypothetical protein
MGSKRLTNNEDHRVTQSRAKAPDALKRGGESFEVLRRGDRKRFLYAFHYPHDYDGNNHRHIPKEGRGRMFSLFEDMDIQVRDLVEIKMRDVESLVARREGDRR